MNLLTDPLLTLAGGGKVSLPALFAAMARGEARGFPALRPHQRPAWHMFLVQLAALSLWTAQRGEPSRDAAEWAAMLRGLTPGRDDDAPWRLVEADWSKPAFLQAPAPEGLNWSAAPTPDALDMLITARNHDLKQTVAGQAAPEDWVFALVSLQTGEGYGGAGNYGIARMNGGSSSRPLLGLAPARGGDTTVDPSAWWARDVRRLIAERKGNPDRAVGQAGGPALLWLLDWPQGRQLDLRDLDPWFIEICRRVRLTETGGGIAARRAASQAARIDAKVYKGAVGDPWAPVHKTEGKSFTLGSGDFDYRQIVRLMFSGDWTQPLLARPGSGETGGMLLVAEALSRGNGKTEGFKSRIVRVPGKAVRLFSSETTGNLSKTQMEEIRSFDKALRGALALVAARGDWKARKPAHYAFADAASKQLNRAADRLFFPSLWRRVAADSESGGAKFAAKIAFLAELKQAAEKAFEAALPAVPCPAVLRPRAEARARRALRGGIWGKYPQLFQEENVDAAA